MKKTSTRWGLFCAILLAGCGGASDDQATTPRSTAQDPATAPATDTAGGAGSSVEMQLAEEPTSAESTPTTPATPQSAATAGTPGTATTPAGMAGQAGPSGPSGSTSTTGSTKTDLSQPAAAPSNTAGPATGAVTKAQADVKLLKDSTLVGTLHFEQQGNQLTISGDFTGLPKGQRGFHIHENGDCGGKNAKNAGGHFNPTKAKHGPPESGTRHAGDFGNLMVDDSGNANFTMTTDSLTVTGTDSVVGRSIVIMSKKDNGKSQPAGASGVAIACGVIEAKGALDSTTGKSE